MRLGILGLRAARLRRARLFEAVGSARYSRTALDDLDRKLAPYLDDAGIFVEAGANDGFRKSNTYYLERFRGWTGVLVEPIPALAEQCRKCRPRASVHECALVGAAHTAPDVVIRYADLCSEIAIEGRPPPLSVWSWDEPYDIAVPARTLSDVLAEAGTTHVDFLCLDLQGFEAEALSGLDFARWTPRLMLIEILDDDAQRAVDAVLGPRYERVGRLAPQDVLYRLAEDQTGDAY